MNRPRTVDEIVQKVRESVTEKKLEQLDAVARKMLTAESDVADFLRAIRSRKGMMFYISTSGVGRLTLKLDVRVHGVNCGHVLWRGDAERTFKPINHTGPFSECGGEEWPNGTCQRL